MKRSKEELEKDPLIMQLMGKRKQQQIDMIIISIFKNYIQKTQRELEKVELTKKEIVTLIEYFISVDQKFKKLYNSLMDDHKESGTKENMSSWLANKMLKFENPSKPVFHKPHHDTANYIFDQVKDQLENKDKSE